MNNHQRGGVYQPLMENIPIYDLSDEEVEEEEHSRLPLLIMIALVVLAAFAGVVWLAYNQGVARGRAGAAIVIEAQNGPVRTAPTDGGAGGPPYTGLKVYEQPVPPDQEAQASALAPAVPRTEILPPAAPVPKPQASATSETPPVRLNPEAKAVVTPRPAPAPAVPAKPAAQAAAPAAAVPAKPAAQTATAVPVVPAKPAAQAVGPAAVPQIAPSSAISAVSGSAVLQIGAYETPEIANGAWNALRTRFASVVGTLAQDVQKADLGAKGTWYRLRVGPFADKAAAVAACEKLRAQGGTCFVAAP